MPIWTRDNRLPYLTDENNRALALFVSGPVRRVPAHELVFHDGVSHENPVVERYWTLRWLFPVRMERRWYPVNFDAFGEDNLGTIRSIVADHAATMRRGQTMELVTMNASVKRRAEKVENQTQRQNRGVPWFMLRRDRNNIENWQ